MRATVLSQAIILTKTQKAAVSMMARALPLRYFLFLLPHYIHVYVA